MVEQERVELAAGFPNRGSLRGKAGVAADHPLAAGAGYAILREGGSAADAAVAMGAVMTVVQPHYSHVGGDAFAVVYRAAGKQVEALNSSGPAPESTDADAFHRSGGMTTEGASAVTIPGCVGGWWALHQKDGKLPWARLFQDAIRIAREGYPASRGLRRAVGWWPARNSQSAHFDATFGHLTTDAGAPVVQPLLAATLETIAAKGEDGFYSGSVAEACLAAMADGGVQVSASEWRSPAEWVRPLSLPFGTSQVHIQPPPSRGLVLALAAKQYSEAGERGAVPQFKALEQAFGVVNALAGDPRVTGFDAHKILEEGGVADAAPSGPPDGDTTYVLAVDADGNAVSWIQSVFAPWGSTAWVEGTGILLNNRMAGFTPREGHPNDVAPGKRPMHTLHSYLVTDEATGHLRMVGGSPGAHRQPTTNLQMLDAVLLRGMDAQDALDLPRWSVGSRQGGRSTVEVEIRADSELRDTFESAGMIVRPVEGWHGMMGRSFLAVADEHGGYAFAQDLRGEGSALVL